MKDLKMLEVNKINALVTRIFYQLDTYEMIDNGYTMNDIRKDLVNRPLDIIDYLLTELENVY